MRALLATAFLLFSTAAMAQTGEASIGSQIAVDSYHEGMKVELVSIDGRAVDSGSSMWGEDTNISYPLTPGSHTLGLHVAAGAAASKMDAVIFVTAGQQYALGAQTVLDQQTQEPQSYIAWVQDATGARVWVNQFSVITTMEYKASPWQH